MCRQVELNMSADVTYTSNLCRKDAPARGILEPTLGLEFN